MPHQLVADYLAERDECIRTIETLKNVAQSRGGDPSDSDIEVMNRSLKRIDKLDELIKVVGEDRTMDEETRAKLTQQTPQSPGGVHYRNGGEMVWDCLHASYGSQHNVDDQEAKRRWDRVMKRAGAEHMGTSAAETTPVAGDVGGLFVQPVVGPVISLFPQGQPFLTAIGRRPAPDAMTFVRPRIVDPDFENGVAPQTLQKSELVSKKFDVKVDTLSLSTIGGYLNVSQQLMSIQPSAWNIILSQMQSRLANAGERAAITEASQTGAHVTLAPNATPAAVLGALFEAAAMVYENTNELPSWIAYGPKGWAMLGSLVDAAGRPLFPFLGASNAMGTASITDMNVGPLGLNSIVTPGITDTNLYMGNAMGMECYVYSFPILEAVEPSLLGRQVAVAEAMCFYRPTTKEAVPSNGNGGGSDAEQNGIVKIGPAAPSPPSP